MYKIIKENEQEVLKELLNYSTIEMFLSTDDFKSLTGDYSSIFISFSIEFDRGDKGFVAISIPHSFLQYLLI